MSAKDQQAQKFWCECDMYLGVPTYFYVGVVREELLQAFVRQS
jgi:hypothetical protein